MEFSALLHLGRCDTNRNIRVGLEEYVRVRNITFMEVFANKDKHTTFPRHSHKICVLWDPKLRVELLLAGFPTHGSLLQIDIIDCSFRQQPPAGVYKSSFGPMESYGIPSLRP